MLASDVRHGEQRGLGLLEIEIVQRVSARLDLHFHHPLGNHLALGGAFLQFLEGHLGVVGERVMSADGIGQNQGVFAVLVLEEIIDAFLLHQAADEIEIRLAVLDAVFPGL